MASAGSIHAPPGICSSHFILLKYFIQKLLQLLFLALTCIDAEELGKPFLLKETLFVACEQNYLSHPLFLL